MEREELLRRIEKKEKDIQKIEKRIAKWTNGLRAQDIEVLIPFGNCVYGTAPRGSRWSDFHGTKEYQLAYDNYKEYKEKEGQNIPSNEDWNKGPCFSEAYSAYRDLGEARNTLANYKVQLEKLDNFENEEKIEAIWNFLCAWEQNAYNWYLENAKKYFDLKCNYSNAKATWKNEYLTREPEPSKEDAKVYSTWRWNYHRAEERFTEAYFQKINALTTDITSINGHYGEYDENYNRPYIYDSYTVDTEKLAKVLSEEKSKKYVDLVKRVTVVVGNIVDASDLHIGKKNGEINGIVIGDKSRARVETISAGGYNIVCFHYRVLVHEIR